MNPFLIIVSAATATVPAGAWLRWAVKPVRLAFVLGQEYQRARTGTTACPTGRAARHRRP